VTKAATNPQLE